MPQPVPPRHNHACSCRHFCGQLAGTDRIARRMSGVDHGREPCPDRILDDVGGAFGMGAVGGGLWHLISGARNSPSGYRVRGGLEAVRREAPRIGGSFAVWGGLFSTFDCSLVAIRRKEVKPPSSLPSKQPRALVRPAFSRPLLVSSNLAAACCLLPFPAALRGNQLPFLPADHCEATWRQETIPRQNIQTRPPELSLPPHPSRSSAHKPWSET